jgi:hypothetical protein
MPSLDSVPAPASRFRLSRTVFPAALPDGRCLESRGFDRGPLCSTSCDCEGLAIAWFSRNVDSTSGTASETSFLGRRFELFLAGLPGIRHRHARVISLLSSDASLHSLLGVVLPSLMGLPGSRLVLVRR